MNTSINWKALTCGILIATNIAAFAGTSQTVGTAAKDTWITAQIKSDLAANSATHAINISVETNNGNVTLSGNTASDTEATTAVLIAESTQGVNNVDASQLNVSNSNQPLTDAYITAKIKGLFIKDKIIGGGSSVPVTQVKVETQQGVVYLSGTVNNHYQLRKAISLANSVDGVSKVISTLSIGS